MNIRINTETLNQKRKKENRMEHFEILNQIDVNEKTEKKNGLNYLSWAWAWTEVKKKYPNATYEIEKFENNLPYVFDSKTGYMVFTKVTIEDITHEMWLPVMDNANKTMLDHQYQYKVKKYDKGKWTGEYEDKTVEVASMFDINKTIMRCLTKNLAMFGLGLYIYAGEDLPEEPIEYITEENLAIIEKNASEQEIKKLKVYYKVKDLKQMEDKYAEAIIKKQGWTNEETKATN